MSEIAVRCFFWFRKVSPRPPGSWVLQGFDTYEGRCDHGKKLEFDAEVSDVFSAPSNEEAEKLPPAEKRSTSRAH